MNLLKSFLTITLASTLLFTPSNQSFAGSTATRSPVLLQINEYNILYTYPKQPYIDSQQRLIVPLRAVSELLGASVSYNSKLKEATIKKNGKEIILTGNSNIIKVNGIEKTLDTVPVIYKQSFLLPIRVLLDNMNLKGTHDSQTGILHVDDDAINSFNMLKDIKEWDISTDRIANQKGLLTSTFELKLSEESKNQLQQGSINITAKNISGDSIPKGKEDLHVMFLYSSTYQMEADLNPTTEQQRTRPALTSGQVFRQKTEFTAANYGEYLKYIIAVGRILK